MSRRRVSPLRAGRPDPWFAFFLLVGLPALVSPLSTSAEEVEIQAIRWLRPGADRVEALTTRPAECSVSPDDPERAHAVLLGRIAFRSPVLLGGLAGRLEMRCDSCHRNGHDHPDFFFSGVSGAPGTVDVTANVFSTRRDDGVFNPVEIPSLVDVAGRDAFGTVVPIATLSTFVRGVIIDEFDGPPPPESVARGLVAYLESLRREACPAEPSESTSFSDEVRSLEATSETLVGALDRDDRAGAEFVLLSWRAALGRLYRRFPESVPEREAIVELSRELASIRPLLEPGGNEAKANGMLADARSRQRAILEALAPHVADSYFDADRLRRAVE